MIRIFIGALLLYTAPYKVFGQKNNVEILQPKLLLRFNILNLVDPIDQNLCFGFEKRFHPNGSAGTDVGWIFRTSYINKSKGVTGVIVRPFLRYYPKRRKSFWEAELLYKYVSYKIEDWLGRMPVNNIPAYEEFTSFNLQKHVAGIHFKWGIQSNLSRNHRLKLEFVSGLGIRFKWNKVRDGIYTTSRGIINVNNVSTQTYIGPVIPVNLRLVYSIK